MPTNDHYQHLLVNIIKCFFCVLVFIVVPNLMNGQRLLYRHLTVEDGLPSLTVHQITQDQLGYLWFATNKGVARYDGYEFTNYTTYDGLPNNDIREIFIDNQNRVWLSSRSSVLTYIDKGEIIQLAPLSDEKRFNVKLNGFHQYQDTIWVDTEQGIYFFATQFPKRIKKSRSSKSNKNKVQYQLETFSIPNKDWELLDIDLQGVKWFYDDNAVLFPNGKAKQPITIPLPEDEFLDSRIFRWSEHLLYFETENQFYFYHTQLDSLMPFNLSSGVALGAQRPPYLVSRRAIQHFKNDTSLALQTDYEHQAQFSLQGAFRDRENNWWLNTLGDGVYWFTANAQLSNTYGIADNLDDPFITASTRDNLGNLFLGSENGDLYIISPNDEIPLLFPLANARKIRKLAIDNDYLYVGSEQGLHFVHQDNFDFLMFGFGMSSDMMQVDCSPPNCIIEKQVKNYLIRGQFRNIYDLYLHDNQLLVAGESGLWSVVLDDETAFVARQIHDQPSYAVIVKNNRIWSGGSNGIELYDWNTLKSVTNEANYLKSFNYPVKAFALESEGKVWIGTDGYGLFYSDDKIYSIEETGRDIIEQIVIDNQNTIWTGTNNGVKRVKLIEPVQEDAADNRKADYQVRAYSIADGLPTQEVQTVFYDKQSIYVGTNRGFTVMNKIRLSKNRAAPPMYINKILVNNREVAPSNRYELSFRQNNITVQYVGISFKSNKNVTYRYKMEGADRNWQKTNRTELSFRGLSSGRYTLYLQAIDIEGERSAERVLIFIIRPPFWESWWFRLSVITLVSGLVAIFVWQRISNIQKREQEKAKSAQEKAALQLKIAEELAEIERINNELAKSKLETLQAQMNPHFAYNALTSIQKFILKKDNKTANKYLVKFARLMRQFLEASKESYIQLDKEIELLQLYIEMEQLRFKDKFEVAYEIDPMVKLGEVPIPSMLLQVFVENAINHGLVYKEGSGLLKFIVRLDEREADKVWCIVEDDGIGRQKAQAIKKQSAGSYKGLGMKISRERVKYLNMTESTKVHIYIDDDILGEGLGGTRVRVAIENQRPLKNNKAQTLI